MDRGAGDQRDTGDGARHVEWDWNGTLFNDHVGVVAAVNDALELVGAASVDPAPHSSPPPAAPPPGRPSASAASWPPAPSPRSSGRHSTTPTTTATTRGWSGWGWR